MTQLYRFMPAWERTHESLRMEQRWRNLGYLRDWTQILCFCGHYSQKVQFRDRWLYKHGLWLQGIVVDIHCFCPLSPFLRRVLTELDLLPKKLDTWSKPGKTQSSYGIFQMGSGREKPDFQSAVVNVKSESEGNETNMRSHERRKRVPLISEASSTLPFPWFDYWLDRFQLY